MRALDVKFAEWHLSHPEVYRFLVGAARKYKHRKPSLTTLFALARLEGYPVNDLYRGRYARLIERQEADLKGLFNFRAMRT
jgi:hypothetical protein